MLSHAPNLDFVSLTVDDQTGNNNGNLNPGEAADLIVTLVNAGSSPASDVQGHLICYSPYIAIWTSECPLGEMPVGGSATANFNVSVSTTCPINTEIEFLVVGTTAAGFADTTSFTTIVADPLYAPVGPDANGYYAYDNYDLPQLNLYIWMEISADSGGPGTQVPFVNDDQVISFPLPFTFQYYGIEYDSITISSNGFLAMGVETHDDYSNSGIPNSDGPTAMIASYWEDLSPQRPNSGKVWQYYDETECLYIVEFNHVEQFAPTGNFETFQTILYDPEYYATFTGDGKIKAQYKEMSDVSQTEGTIGIENHTETIGLQYLFDGAYDVHAFPLEPGRAILYSTLDGAPGITVTLTPQTLPIVIPPPGGSFQYTVEINNYLIALNFDAWIEAVMPDTSVYGPILLRQNMFLNPGGQIFRNMTQNVPGSAPAGNYTYRCKVGVYPSIMYESDDFDFSKSGVDLSGVNTGWNLSGWDIEDSDPSVTIPDKYYLAQNSPNPFNPATEINFSLPQNCRLEIKVYDLLGREVETLFDGWMEAGVHVLSFDASKLSSGIYFYTMRTPDYSAARKMLLVK